MILVRSDVQDVVELDSLTTTYREEVIGVEIKGDQRRPSMNVITYYNPPGNMINAQIFNLNQYPGTRTVITGDLNSKHLAWGSNTTDPHGKFLLETLNDQNWVILNDGSKTRCDPVTAKEEVLDLIVCSPHTVAILEGFFVGDDDVGSDHYPLHANFIS